MASLGQPSWLLVKVNPIAAKPRTIIYPIIVPKVS